jgi:Holliday junction resolvasome RuvABC endonuclease subunit
MLKKTQTSPPGADPGCGVRGVVLALDLGQNTGWALRDSAGRVTSGTQQFKPGRFEGGGMPLLRFVSWLNELQRAAGPLACVFFEEVRAHRGTAAAHAYGAFLGHMTAWCESNRLPYQGVPVSTIKLAAAGRGNASKDEVVSAMRALGFDPVDDNEADALALLHSVCLKSVEAEKA